MPRLPIPGSDDGTWGQILNQYLQAEHNPDGSHLNTLKNPDWSVIASKPSEFPPASHTHTKTDIGLGNVDNTSDVAKPVSTAVQAALNAKANQSHGHTSSEITDATVTGRTLLTAANSSSALASLGINSSNTYIRTAQDTNFGVYEPLFLSTSGLANTTNAFATASGGGLVASVAGTMATGTMNLPYAINASKPFRFATLLEYGGPGTDSARVTLYNSSNLRSQIDIILHGNSGYTVAVGYGSVANSVNQNLSAGQKYWLSVMGDGTYVTVSILPFAQRYGLGGGGYNGNALADFAVQFAANYTEGGNPSFVGLNTIKVSNSSTAHKILGVWINLERIYGGSDSRFQPPAVIKTSLANGDTTPIIRLPEGYTGKQATDVVLWFHPNNSSENSQWQLADADQGAAAASLAQQGYIVATSRGTNDFSGTTYSGPLASNWGAYAGLAYRRDLLSWIHTNLPGTRNVYIVGCSMGLLNALNFHARWPGLVKAIVGISGVTNLSYAYSSEGFKNVIDAAYGVSTISSITDQDPNLRPGTYTNIPIKLWHGDADTVIHKTNHADLFASNVNAAGGNVNVVNVPGAAHLTNASLFNGPAIGNFFRSVS